MNKKNALVICFLFTFILSSYSQNDWQKGYIIKTTNDTIYGFIDYRSQKTNSQYCYFKEDSNSQTSKYTPEQINGYKFINGKYYISKSVNINDFETFAFVEFLLKGKANLYYLGNENLEYLIEVDGKVHELINSEIKKNINGKEYVKERKEYIGTLNYLFHQANMKEEINKTKLNHNSLIKTTKNFNDKVSPDQECIVYTKSSKPLKIKFGAVYGVNNKTINLDRALNYELSQDPSNYFGAAFNFQNIPGIYERFSLQLELLLSEFNIENTKQYHINIPLLVNYKLSAKKFYPKIELGTSMYFIQDDQVNTQHMNLIAGLSIYYDYFEDFSVFISTRVESKPGIFRFGVGFMF